MLAKSRTILMAEDNPDDRFLFREAWMQAGIPNPLQMVEDGQEACDYLSGAGTYADRARYPFPALIALDIKMPGKSGLEVLAWLRGQEKFQRIPVIIVTASTWPGDVAQAYRLGANSFVVKPSAVQDLVDFATAVKAYWLRFNEFPDV